MTLRQETRSKREKGGSLIKLWFEKIQRSRTSLLTWYVPSCLDVKNLSRRSRLRFSAMLSG